jgi:hypothetical protein
MTLGLMDETGVATIEDVATAIDPVAAAVAPLTTQIYRFPVYVALYVSEFEEVETSELPFPSKAPIETVPVEELPGVATMEYTAPLVTGTEYHCSPLMASE